MEGMPPPARTLVPRRFAARLATLACALLLGYLLPALLLDARVAGVTLTRFWIAGAFIVGTAGLAIGLDRTLRLSAGALFNLALLAVSLLSALLVADISISAYLRLTEPNTDLVGLARTERNALVEEWYPRLYYPTAANFRVHKPNFTITGRHYGGFYLPGMLRSRTLADSVLDLREVTIHIDSLGFRERSPIDGCPIYALGDSFTFGWGVSEGSSWPDLLEGALGRCVYNLGVNGASPWQEHLLLADLLSRDVSRAPRRVLWAIYEGNDLDHPFADEEAPAALRAGPVSRAIEGTVLDGARLLVRNLRTGSLIYRLRTGDIELRRPASSRAMATRYRVDGVELATPIFKSPKLGYMLVDDALLRNAAQPEPAVRDQYRRAGLDRTFDRMRQLAESRGFAVTVVVFPASVRLYAPAFDFTPVPSSVPHLVNYLTELSRKNGFDVLSMLAQLEPTSRTELLYFRDDEHLNARGHEVVARLLAQHLRAVEAPVR